MIFLNNNNNNNNNDNIIIIIIIVIIIIMIIIIVIIIIIIIVIIIIVIIIIMIIIIVIIIIILREMIGFGWSEFQETREPWKNLKYRDSEHHRYQFAGRHILTQDHIRGNPCLSHGLQDMTTIY